jgi:hypothetical protein
LTFYVNNENEAKSLGLYGPKIEYNKENNVWTCIDNKDKILILFTNYGIYKIEHQKCFELKWDEKRLFYWGEIEGFGNKINLNKNFKDNINLTDLNNILKQRRINNPLTTKSVMRTKGKTGKSSGNLQRNQQSSTSESAILSKEMTSRNLQNRGSRVKRGPRLYQSTPRPFLHR